MDFNTELPRLSDELTELADSLAEGRPLCLSSIVSALRKNVLRLAQLRAEMDAFLWKLNKDMVRDEIRRKKS